MILRRTVGVFRWVLDNTMSKKSAAVGTGAIAFRPLVDMVSTGIDGQCFVLRVSQRKKKIRFLTMPHDLSKLKARVDLYDYGEPHSHPGPQRKSSHSTFISRWCPTVLCRTISTTHSWHRGGRSASHTVFFKSRDQLHAYPTLKSIP